ncbi:MAG TPA: patatin-like phospholipase family protein [Actinomycetota bacterium]|nr:patatin-like phospholipase family protein [Actinomycetota bacterium]
MTLGIVFGGGGLVGMAYHAAALQALHDMEIDVTGADVVVGTSAGSVIGSYMATGWSQTDFYEYAHRRHPNAHKDPADPREAQQELFVPLWTTPSERVRRSIGSFFALASSKGLWHRATRGMTPVAELRRRFPAGLYSTAMTKLRLQDELPAGWPDRKLFVCAADLYTGERVPFGTDDAPKASLPDAVLASTAIPGVFPPVRIDGRQYVDGGAVSATSLDLAADAGCEAIICIAPLGYRNEGALVRDPLAWGPMITRSFFARTLRREVRDARERGIDVFVIRPWLDELRHLGTNAMRQFDRVKTTEIARAGVRRLLKQEKGHPALAAFRR